MTRSGWKAVERRIAEAVGGKRIPVTGERDGADVVARRTCIQVKCRKAIPGWLWNWFAGICRVTPPDKIPALVLKWPGMRDDDALVVMRFSDFVPLLNPANTVTISSECRELPSSESL
jgi:hypothetical protein